MPYPEEASITEMVNYTVQALWIMETVLSDSVKRVRRHLHLLYFATRHT